MIDILYVVVLIATIIVIIFFLCWCGGRLKDNENVSGLKLLLWLVVCVALIIATWYINIVQNIKRDEAGIIAYKQYKNEYSDEKIIDTQIEQTYIDAIKELEYYKSIGLYGGKEK